jgi:hypothetical protein
VKKRGAILSWCFYDWAMSAYNTVIGTFIFSVYFTRGVAESEVIGTAQWGRAVAVSGIAVALLSPVLGAIADRSGRRKPWLALFTALTVAGTALLWFVRPDPAYALPCLVLIALTNVTFELANVFYNAMLPALAPPGFTGRVSGWGWGLGYIGGLGCLVLSLFGLVQAENPLFGLIGTEDQANVRATALLVALWYAVFALPLFLVTPDQPSAGIGLGHAVRLRRNLCGGNVRHVVPADRPVRDRAERGVGGRSLWLRLDRRLDWAEADDTGMPRRAGRVRHPAALCRVAGRFLGIGAGSGDLRRAGAGGGADHDGEAVAARDGDRDVRTLRTFRPGRLVRGTPGAGVGHGIVRESTGGDGNHSPIARVRSRVVVCSAGRAHTMTKG